MGDSHRTTEGKRSEGPFEGEGRERRVETLCGTEGGAQCLAVKYDRGSVRPVVHLFHVFFTPAMPKVVCGPSLMCPDLGSAVLPTPPPDVPPDSSGFPLCCASGVPGGRPARGGRPTDPHRQPAPATLPPSPPPGLGWPSGGSITRGGPPATSTPQQSAMDLARALTLLHALDLGHGRGPGGPLSPPPRGNAGQFPVGFFSVPKTR